MTTERITPLSDANLRDVWSDEARDFTPWLLRNINFLSDALGIELEAIDSEVSVNQFSADIVARDVRTSDRVLIENQLELSDHTHLGQILTYLSGLDAKSIVWLARGFHDAHLSAIKWLNEHTSSEFAFFAVRLRVVRIGDSPFAPVFEILEKPNNWEREVRERTSDKESELTGLRRRFWDRYRFRHKGVIEASRHSNVWIPMLPDSSVILSMYVGSRASGMFLRGQRGGVDEDEWTAILAPHLDKLKIEFGVRQISNNYDYANEVAITIRDEDRWDELIDWMEAQRGRYAGVFNQT